MNKNRYKGREWKEIPRIPDFNYIRGSKDVFSFIKDKLCLYYVDPIGPGRYCLYYTSEYDSTWRVGRITEFQSSFTFTNSSFILIQGVNGNTMRIEYPCVRGLPTEEGYRAIRLIGGRFEIK